MGMAASQARLLSITSRIHDVEYQAQMIQSAKMQLALQEDEVYRRYNEALDAASLTFQDTNGNRIAATFNNLCGLGSITNNIATNKSYIFRDDCGNVIVPTDVFEGYQEYGGTDPYAFALYMLTEGDYEDKAATVTSAIEEYFTNMSDDFFDTEANSALKTELSDLFDELYESSSTKDKDEKEQWKKDILTAFLNNSSIDDYFTEEDFKNNNICSKIKTARAKAEQLVHKSFTSNKENIYASIPGNDKDEFDSDKFNYYLRWGKLLQLEEVNNQNGVLTGCTCASDYSSDIEGNAEELNKWLQSGRITIDMIYIDYKTGKLSDEPTAASSDSNLAYTANSSIDSRELKKAEAEYEKAMKDIDRKDKQFDMDLNRLETERTALTTEYDSVKQVIKDNIERTFGIFS